MYSMVTPVCTCCLSVRNTLVHSYCLYLMKNCIYCLYLMKTVHQSVVTVCVQNDNISAYLLCIVFQCVLTFLSVLCFLVYLWSVHYNSVCTYSLFYVSVCTYWVLCLSVYLLPVYYVSLCTYCLCIIFQCVLTVCASCFSVSHSILQGPASHRVHVRGAWHARCTRTKTPPHRLAAGKIHQRN